MQFAPALLTPVRRARALFPFAFASALALASPGDAATRGADFADPYVVRDGAEYYAFATGAAGKNLQVARSRDLSSWSTLPDALPRLPRWSTRATGLTWAPSILRRESGYVLYYVTRDDASGFQCISRARSKAPGGPYVDDSERAFVCQVGGDAPHCGSIDPSPFVAPGGRAYLLWKSDENSASCRTAPRIWSQPLSDDGSDVVGSPAPLLRLDRPWEGTIIEAPSMVLHDASYYLFYSANAYESADYAIGYARCAGPSGPCTKATTAGPLVASTPDMLGPGGQEFFTDGAGATWMAFHAWTAPRFTYADGGSRSLRFARVSFADGTPGVDRTARFHAAHAAAEAPLQIAE
jgi:beta-xylosidase